MDAVSAVREMLGASGLTAYAAARRAGRSHTYVSNVLGSGSVPTASKLATIAAACGYRLLLVPEDREDPEGAIPVDCD